MTPIEKAETALNRRIERLQANLREATSEAAREFLVQSILVTIGIGEALADYVRMIGQYAQGRHAELKQTHDSLTKQHADLLTSGNELLERLRAEPTDQAVRKEIDQVQRSMTAIQKALKRGANALQRDVAPSTATIDKLALRIRRLGEADESEALKRAIRTMVEHAGELYHEHPGVPAKDIIDAEAWKKSAGAEIEQANDSHEAFARAGYQAMLALEAMTLAVSPAPPRSAEEAMGRAGEAVTTRLKAIAARFTAG